MGQISQFAISMRLNERDIIIRLVNVYKGNKMYKYFFLNETLLSLIVKNDIAIVIENIDQKECIEFSGFDHEDRDQQVTCSIFYDGQLLDTNVLCSFQMKNN